MTDIKHISESGDDSRHSAGAEGFSIGRFILLINRKRNPVGVFTLAAGIVAAVGAFLLPNTYKATTVLMPPQKNISSANALLSQLGGVTSSLASETGIKDPNGIFIAILESRTIADTLIQQFNLKFVYHKCRAEDLRESLTRATEIRSDKSGTIVLSVEDKDANRAAAMANSYVREMYKLDSALAMTEGAQRRVFYEQQLKAARDDLQKSESEFKNSAENSGIVQIDAQAKGLVEDVYALEAKVAAQEVQVRSLEPYLTAQNAELKRARSELAALQEQLAKVENHPRAVTLDVPTAKLPAAAVEYANRLRDVKYNKSVVEAIGKQYEIARIDEAKNAPLVQVIDPAVPPTKESGPYRLAIILISMLSAFVLAAGYLLVRDFSGSNSTAWTEMRNLLAQR